MKENHHMSNLLINRRITQRRARIATVLMALIITAVVGINPLRAQSDTVIATLDVAGGPRAIGVNASTNRIYVANYDDQTVSVIDGSTNIVLGSPIPLGKDNAPDALAVNATTNRVYVVTFSIASSDQSGG